MRLDSVFYAASNNLLSVSTTIWKPNGDTLVTTSRWRPDKTLIQQSTSLGRHRQHESVSYHATGVVRSKKVYAFGKEISAVCFTETGTSAACPEYRYTEKMPVYPGGSPALFAYIGSSIRYPKEALKKKKQGAVVVTFVVDETGQVRNARIKHSISAELDAEALRVLRGLARFEPGQQNGETVPVFYTVPVTFAIR
ncbi:hypothetical protein GCM10011378_27670 [Hymenobacter glacieicola]|uniref:TonB C-terminal domain-containing protein n=2 Tax=Hymenobacter glacieicola TaxID=1562124 RepID=A0ABQ1X0G9_9BACT|nr:hypothetical protein GCM10011378_27670 [Hymenobacter glacieicola]